MKSVVPALSLRVVYASAGVSASVAPGIHMALTRAEEASMPDRIVDAHQDTQGNSAQEGDMAVRALSLVGLLTIGCAMSP